MKEKMMKKDEEDEEDEEDDMEMENAKNAATNSRPQTHWSNTTQPVAGPSRVKQSSEPQAAAASPNALTNATSPAAIASSTPHANAVILRHRCCIPFLSFNMTDMPPSADEHLAVCLVLIIISV